MPNRPDNASVTTDHMWSQSDDPWTERQDALAVTSVQLDKLTNSRAEESLKTADWPANCRCPSGAGSTPERTWLNPLH